MIGLIDKNGSPPTKTHSWIRGLVPSRLSMATCDLFLDIREGLGIQSDD
jgi:hypothetical protein